MKIFKNFIGSLPWLSASASLLATVTTMHLLTAMWL